MWTLTCWPYSIAFDLRLLEQAYAQRLRRGRLAKRQIQRVQVPGAHIQQAAEVTLRADHGGQVRSRYPLQRMRITQAQQVGIVFVEALEVTRLGCQVAITPGQVAIDGIAFDALANDLHRLEAHALELIHTLFAEDVGELLDIMADAADQLAAVAPAGAPADAVRFQQDDAEPAFGQFDGGIEAGEAATDDAHVGPLFALQGLEGQLAVDARGIVGRCMVAGVRSGCTMIH